MENIDIKDFQSVSAVSETDSVLLVRGNGMNGKMTVALFKSAVKGDMTPSIKDGVWWIGTLDTGVTAAGRTPEFRKGEAGIEWRYAGEPDWKLLAGYDSISFTFDDLTEEQKDALKLKFADLTEDDVQALQRPAREMIDLLQSTNTSVSQAEALRVSAENKRQADTSAAILSATEAAQSAHTAAENVSDGKTPVLGIGTVSQGAQASASLSANGTDGAGNPKYSLNLVLPKGDKGDPGTDGTDGKTPVLEFGNITTGAPGTQASATLTAAGMTADGHPIYRLSLTIPRGDKGIPGEGSGNVSASGAGLHSGKNYLFSPSSDGSTDGRFVQYTEPPVPAKVSELENDSDFADKDYVTQAISEIDIPELPTYDVGSNSVNTLTGLPVDKRLVVASLAAASDITLSGTLSVGREILVSITPTSDFTQPLPVSGGWLSLDGDSLEVKSGKPAEISILCVGDNRYVVSSKSLTQ